MTDTNSAGWKTEVRGLCKAGGGEGFWLSRGLSKAGKSPLEPQGGAQLVMEGLLTDLTLLSFSTGVAKLKAMEATVKSIPVEMSCSSLLREPWERMMGSSDSLDGERGGGGGGPACA